MAQIVLKIEHGLAILLLSYWTLLMLTSCSSNTSRTSDLSEYYSYFYKSYTYGYNNNQNQPGCMCPITRQSSYYGQN
jgi:hypothetical protein